MYIRTIHGKALTYVYIYSSNKVGWEDTFYGISMKLGNAKTSLLPQKVIQKGGLQPNVSFFVTTDLFFPTLTPYEEVRDPQ